MVIVTIIISLLTPGVSILLLLKTDLRTNAVILGYLLVQSGIGLIFYLIFSIMGMAGVGVIIMAALALTGFGIGTIKIPTFGNTKLVKNLGRRIHRSNNL